MPIHSKDPVSPLQLAGSHTGSYYYYYYYNVGPLYGDSWIADDLWWLDMLKNLVK